MIFQAQDVASYSRCKNCIDVETELGDNSKTGTVIIHHVYNLLMFIILFVPSVAPATFFSFTQSCLSSTSVDGVDKYGFSILSFRLPVLPLRLQGEG